MAKIPFDIKYRPQIESGEYKVENRKGEPVRVVCYDAIISDFISGYQRPIISLQKDDVLGEDEVICHFQNGMVYRGKEDKQDLFIVTPEPEPEMTEFEQEVSDIVEYCKLHGKNVASDYAKRHAKALLSVARETLEPEVLKRLDEAYKNQDEVVYENGKRDGKAEALKNLPRWRYKKDGTRPILHDCIVLNKYGCIGKSPSGALLGDIWTLEYDELAKLPKEKPGFKEEE